MSSHLISLFEGFLRNIGGAIGIKIRYYYYRKRLKSCGENVIIDIGVVFQSPESISLGNNVWIDKNVIILSGKPNLSRDIKFIENDNFSGEYGDTIIDDNCHIAPFVVIQSHGGVFIGKNSGVASGSKIYSLSHHYKSSNPSSSKQVKYFSPMVENEKQSLILSPIVISEGCAIGLNSTILPGTFVPNHTWIGTGLNVIGKDYDVNSVYYLKQNIGKKEIR